MHFCNDCKRLASGGHQEHTDNPLFLSYNMMLVIMKKNPHIRILHNRYFRPQLQFKLLNPEVKRKDNPYKAKHEKKSASQK